MVRFFSTDIGGPLNLRIGLLFYFFIFFFFPPIFCETVVSAAREKTKPVALHVGMGVWVGRVTVVEPQPRPQ